MTRIIILFVFVFASSLYAEAKLSPIQFLELVRNPPKRDSWASMSGTITHKRKGKKIVKMPIYFGVKFSSSMTLGEVVIDNTEGYMIGQQYREGSDATSVESIGTIPNGSESKLAECGLQPEDLTMSFLYWRFVKELEPETIKLQDCRVLLLKDISGSKLVKVYISKEGLFPIKVEWYDGEYAEGNKERTLALTDFEKDDDYWVVTELRLSGPGWRTNVEFNETKAGHASGVGATMPKDLFVEL